MHYFTTNHAASSLIEELLSVIKDRKSIRRQMLNVCLQPHLEGLSFQYIQDAYICFQFLTQRCKVNPSWKLWCQIYPIEHLLKDE